MEQTFSVKGQAQLQIGDKKIELPILEGTYDNQAVDIRALRKQTGLIAYDPGYVNTAHCSSSITFLDGEKGILRYRGYALEDLVEHCSFIQVAYLLVHGKLPTREERDRFGRLLNDHSMLHEDMITFFRAYPEHAHPMAVLSAMVVSLSSFYPEIDKEGNEDTDTTVTRLLSKMRTIAAFSYKKYIGEPFVSPGYKLRYVENFLNMMFSSPVKHYVLDPVVVRALDQLLIIHADHEQNCSTSAVRLVCSSMAGLYAAITAGVCALWGPRHGGANEAVIQMLQAIHKDGGDVGAFLARIKDKTSKQRLMGFGHRIYKTYDPRAKVAKTLCNRVLDHQGIHDPLLDIAMKLEEKALGDPYFQERLLFPNVDFYTGIVYRAIGIPTNMFTVMFALGRIPGWIANWLELRSDPAMQIARPRQLYVGPKPQDVPPIEYQ